MTLQTGSERDVLVLAKTGAANEFPVERPGVIGVDRQTGNLVRLSPFPWKGADTDPPLQRWSATEFACVQATYPIQNFGRRRMARFFGNSPRVKLPCLPGRKHFPRSNVG